MIDDHLAFNRDVASGGKLVRIIVNKGNYQGYRVIYVLEQVRFIVSHEGRNLPILITS